LVVVALAATGYSIGCAFAVALGYSKLFDRYLLPIIPLVAILALHTNASTAAVSRRVRVAGYAALGALAVLGAVFGANSASFDGTKWRVASHAVELVSDPTLVDGGHIWNDYYAGRHLRGTFKGACVVLRAGPRPAPGDPGVVGVGRVWSPTGTQVWVVARESGQC
jgi:hypothetical protein